MDTIISDEIHTELTEDKLSIPKRFKHKTFENRVAEYNGDISVCSFDWGDSDEIEKIVFLPQKSQE